MSERRIRHVIAAFGADLGRWPAKERSEARALLAHDRTSAWRELRQARQLDSLLDRAPELVPGPELASTILARAAATSQNRAPTPSVSVETKGGRGILGLIRDLLGPGRIWPQVASLAAAAVFGFYIGISGIVAFSPPNTTTSGISMDVSDFGGVL